VVIYSFATDKYLDYRSNLINQIMNFGVVKFQIDVVPDEGDRLANTRKKPTYILEALSKYLEPIVWIDVDSHIHKLPKVDIDCDFLYIESPPKNHNRPIADSFHIHNYSPNQIKFLTAWKDRCDKATDGGDHIHLIRTFEEFEGRHTRRAINAEMEGVYTRNAGKHGEINY
jgi:hypothetical protein